MHTSLRLLPLVASKVLQLDKMDSDKAFPLMQVTTQHLEFDISFATLLVTNDTGADGGHQLFNIANTTQLNYPLFLTWCEAFCASLPIQNLSESGMLCACGGVKPNALAFANACDDTHLWRGAVC